MEGHAEVSRSLGRLEAGVDGINSRLDRLNGSVARHEQRIGDLEAKDAALVAKDETNRTWRDALKPAVKILLGFLLGMILSHAPAMLKTLGN